MPKALQEALAYLAIAVIWLTFVVLLVWSIVAAVPPDPRPCEPDTVTVNVQHSHPDTNRRLVVVAQAEKYGVDPLLALQVTLVENWGGHPFAVSPVGAIGIMQVMPNVWWGRFPECGEWLYDVETNACYGVQILRHYLLTCGDDVHCALRRYNGARTAAKAERYVSLINSRYEEAVEWLTAQ